MRTIFSILFIAIIAALAFCVFQARRSKKAIGPSVALLLCALIPPVTGNLMIISSASKTLAAVGCYIYFLGMDLVMFAMFRFALRYCQIEHPNRAAEGIVYSLLGIDAVQLICNLFFGHAFDLEATKVDGFDYYRLLPFAGQTFHRVVDYSLLVAILLIFLVKMIRSSRINSERYSVIFFTMIFIALWQTLYIFSRTPVDRSMIGFGVFGLLVFFFSLYHRPMRLLDRMLANIASEMPEALFFFDAGGRCIWANRPALALTGAEKEDYDQASEKLTAMFHLDDDQVISQQVIGTGSDSKSYVLEMHTVTDDRNHLAGSFISVRDNTDEQRTLQKEVFKSTHDSLTAAYNRAGYDLLLSTLDRSTTFMILLDIDRFKEINDTWGHEAGDRVLKTLVNTVKLHFRSNDYVCRIGGDEFVVLMSRADEKQKQQLSARIDQINEDLSRAEGVPPISISVGIAHGSHAESVAQWFEQADQALYETKHRGRKGYTFYEAEKA